jgi:diaminopimelate decarboxylase
MLNFVSDMERELGFICRDLDIGGGLGVRYVESQPVLDIKATILKVAEEMKKEAKRLGIALPRISLEPGRSIVADAGLTLYTVGTVKRIPGYKTYVSVDGGMTDNPRYALYGAPYTILPVSDEGYDDTEICSVVGRCCESGDILQENVEMPKRIKRGDLVAVLTTGAYNYSMASNYNRIPRLPVVMVNGDEDYVAVKGETLDDIIKNDL